MFRFCILVLASVLGLGNCTALPEEAPPTQYPEQPRLYAQASRSNDPKIKKFSQYVTMRDGVQIAIDVYLPRELSTSETIPTILHQTRYWRSWEYRWPMSWVNGSQPKGYLAPYVKRFLSHHYAWVSVDVRGSGASFGTRRFSHTPEEIQDGAEIVNWIIQQPWSNGVVGTLGISYDGSSAEFLLINQHPAVKAAAPMFSSFDAFREIAFPGGMHFTWFTEHWSQLNKNLDANLLPPGKWLASLFVKGVAPVDSDPDGHSVAIATQEHANNWNPHTEALGITYRDDPSPSNQTMTIDVLSPHTYIQTIRDSPTAIYSYSGWFDGAYPHAAIRRFLTLQQAQHRLILGPWDHGGSRHISPFFAKPESFDHIGELLKFFDFHLKGIDTGLQQESRVHYYTMGEERWKAAETWPPPASMTPYFFKENGILSKERPQNQQGHDTILVDPTAGTGEHTRWNTLIANPIITPYPNRNEEDRKLLCYTTAPLTENIEVTGHPLVTLSIASTAEDGNFFVYLEDINEEGEIAYVTEGLLRAIHRSSTVHSPPYRDVVPYQSFTQKDSRTLQPGSIETLVIDLIPTSYLFKKGHRIRVAISGADKDHFPLTPATPPTVTYYRNQMHASKIDLPIVSPSPNSIPDPK